jgi:hypothetical protein
MMRRVRFGRGPSGPAQPGPRRRLVPTTCRSLLSEFRFWSVGPSRALRPTAKRRSAANSSCGVGLGGVGTFLACGGSHRGTDRAQAVGSALIANPLTGPVDQRGLFLFCALAVRRGRMGCGFPAIGTLLAGQCCDAGWQPSARSSPSLGARRRCRRRALFPSAQAMDFPCPPGL